MIYLEKGITASIALSLTDESNLEGVYNYLFDIQDYENVSVLTFTASDISSFPNSYNEFQMNLNIEKGDYTYFAYYQTNLDNITASNADGLLEVGKLMIN